jgi:hypothetical protein
MGEIDARDLRHHRLRTGAEDEDIGLQRTDHLRGRLDPQAHLHPHLLDLTAEPVEKLEEVSPARRRIGDLPLAA